MPKSTLATVSTDSTGMILTLERGSQRCPQFNTAWQGLQFVLNGLITTPVTVFSVDSPQQMTLTAPIQTNSGPLQLANVPLSPNRETIYQAVFNVIKGIPGLLTSSRRTPPTSQVDATLQPAMFFEQIGERPTGPRGAPYKWELDGLIVLYAYMGDQNGAPVTIINPMVDYIEAAFPGDQNGLPDQLVGLVDEVRLLGDDHCWAGSLGQQATAHIPMRIVAL